MRWNRFNIYGRSPFFLALAWAQTNPIVAISCNPAPAIAKGPPIYQAVGLHAPGNAANNVHMEDVTDVLVRDLYGVFCVYIRMVAAMVAVVNRDGMVAGLVLKHPIIKVTNPPKMEKAIQAISA